MGEVELVDSRCKYLQRLKSIMEPILVAILAGGQSRRMGQDKAQLSLDGGASWLERTARLAHGAAPGVCVVGRARPGGWPLEGTAFLQDAAPGAGPLGGLLAALLWARGEGAAGVLALACDMPALSAEAVRWALGEAALRRPSRGLAVVNRGRVEPLFSIYGAACLPSLEQRLAERRLSLHGLIEGADFEKVEVRADIAPQLRNVNTPEDLAGLHAELAARSPL